MNDRGFMHQYGILINHPKRGIKDRLLTDDEHGIYKTISMYDAEFRARDQLLIFRDRDMNTSIVPLNDDNSFGPPIKKYQLNKIMKVVELLSNSI